MKQRNLISFLNPLLFALLIVFLSWTHFGLWPTFWGRGSIRQGLLNFPIAWKYNQLRLKLENASLLLSSNLLANKRVEPAICWSLPAIWVRMDMIQWIPGVYFLCFLSNAFMENHWQGWYNCVHRKLGGGRECFLIDLLHSILSCLNTCLPFNQSVEEVPGQTDHSLFL